MDAETSNQWRFAQCFGDKGEVDEITEGMSIPSLQVIHVLKRLIKEKKGSHK